MADFETQNYQIMTHLNTGTDLQVSTETAIGFIPCYRLPFLSLFHADCMDIMKQYPDKYFDLAIVDPPYGREIKSWVKKASDARGGLSFAYCLLEQIHHGFMTLFIKSTM